MLTERRQQQAIRDAMAGLDPRIDIDALHPDYKYLWAVVTEDARTPDDATQFLLQVKIDEPDLAEIIDSILRLKPGRQINHPSLTEIGPTLQKVTWLWKSWIPRRLLTVLAADAGVGKTNIALDLAHRLISGLPAPDDQPLLATGRNVIYVDAEGFLPVIYERARAWGTNLDQFYPLERPDREMIDFGQRQYQDQLIDKCYDLHPDMVIVDSLSTISSTGENNVEDLRIVLNFLSEIANSFNTAMVLVHHLRKQGQAAGGRPITMHDLRGSGHLTAIGRSIMGLYVPVDDPNGPRRLVMLKTNLCKHPRPLSLRYIPTSTNPDISYVSYSLLEEPTINEETLTGECAEWLKEVLAAAPQSYADLVAAGADLDYSESIIQIARKKLDWQIIDTIGKQKRGNQWALAPAGDEDPENSPQKPENSPSTLHISHERMTHERGGGSHEWGGGVSHDSCVHESYVNGKEPINNEPPPSPRLSPRSPARSSRALTARPTSRRYPGTRRPERRTPASPSPAAVAHGHWFAQKIANTNQR